MDDCSLCVLKLCVSFVNFPDWDAKTYCYIYYPIVMTFKIITYLRHLTPSSLLVYSCAVTLLLPLSCWDCRAELLLQTDTLLSHISEPMELQTDWALEGSDCWDCCLLRRLARSEVQCSRVATRGQQRNRNCKSGSDDNNMRTGKCRGGNT